jgi:hypothetical protein
MVKMGTVWDRTVEFLGDEIGTLVPIALLAILVPTSINSNLWALMPNAAPGLRLAAGVAVLALSILVLWGQLAVTALALYPARHGATAAATRRLPAALAVMLIVVVACLVAAVPFGVILAASGVDPATLGTQELPAIPPGAGLGLGLYALLLFGVGLWLAARLMLVTPIVVAERRALGAFGRSFALTRGLALKIIGVLFLFVLVSWVAQGAATLVFGSIFRLVTNGEGGAVSLASVLTTIVVAVVETGFTVLGTAFTAKLYAALAPSPASPAA